MKFDLDPLWLEHRTIRRSLASVSRYFSGRILDVGCGEMPYKTLLSAGASEYVGVDRDSTPPKNPDICCDVLSLPFPDGSFDTVFSTQVLEHVPDPFKMFSEMARVVRPGGHLIVTAPQAWPLHEEPYDFFRYTRYGLERFAAVNRLEVVQIAERGGGLMALGQIFAGILEERCRRSRITRIPMKLVVFPILLASILLDKLFYYPRFTLGYTVVARKPAADRR